MKCFCCEGDKFTEGDGDWDEGDAWWCHGCIREWVKNNKADWATGQPKVTEEFDLNKFVAEEENQGLALFVVYKNPKDYPGSYVMRQQRIEGGKIIHGQAVVGPTLESVRTTIPPDRVAMPPMEGDDPCIVEVWI